MLYTVFLLIKYYVHNKTISITDRRLLFDIHCVLVTEVNDQKTQQQLTAGVFFSYKPAVVNYG